MFELRVDGFEGPFDLLLNLIEKEKIGITEISLAQVADQYWNHIRADGDGDGDPETLAEFIAIGVRLLYLKSCALLPQPAFSGQPRRAQDTDDGANLVEMLEQYKRFRDVALLFRDIEEKGRKVYRRSAPSPRMELPPGLQDVSLDTLLSAVRDALERKPEGPAVLVMEIEPVTIAAKIDDLSQTLVRGKGRAPLRSLLEACETRTEVVVLFLALLEMVKMGRLWAEQEQAFGDILLMEVETGRA